MQTRLFDLLIWQRQENVNADFITVQDKNKLEFIRTKN